MKKREVRELADGFIKALHRLEKGEVSDSDAAIDALVSLYANDAHLTNAALRLTGEERAGTDQIRGFWSEYKRTLGDAYSDFHQITVNDEAAGLFWVTKGRDVQGKDGAVHYDGTTLLVFNDDGKITYFQGYYDTRQLNRQMGVEADASGKAG